jgi:hypothetical protein
MKKTFPFFLLIIMASCKPQHTEKQYVFTVPNVVFQDTTKVLDTVFFERTFINGIYPLFCGKYKPTDSVVFDRDRVFNKHQDPNFNQDRVNVDFMPINPDSPLLDSMPTDGLTIHANYKQTILFGWWATDEENAYYTAFISNPTDKTQILIGKDDKIFALQEAKDSHGIWRPIEDKGTEFCGVGYWGLQVHPKEFSTILFPKYKGTFETDMRIRLRNGKHTIVSEAFKGHINPKQFYFKNRNATLDSFRKTRINDFFFGTMPLELDSLAKY